MVSNAYPHNSRANPVDEVIPIDSSIGSFIDVDSGVSVVDSGFLDREVTFTLRLFSSPASCSSLPQVKAETQAHRLKLEAEAAEQAAKKVKETPKKQKKTDKTPGSSFSLSSQFQNPIVANAVIVAAVSAVLGFTGFKKHQAGQLSWKVVGVWSAFVAAFGTADYFVSRFVGVFLSGLPIHLDQDY